MLAILVTLAFRPRSSTWEALRTTALNDAVSAYEEGGEQQLRKYLNEPAGYAACARVLFSTNVGMRFRAVARRTGRSGWLHGGPRISAGRIHHSRAAGAAGFARVVRRQASLHAGDGTAAGAARIFRAEGHAVPGLIIGVITSGLVCYLLAWYLTKPIVRLRAATRQLAAGDLTARSGAPASKRRDEVAGLMRDFDAMAERLEMLVKAQSRLLNDISHELRSPLARLNVALGLARQRAGVESADMLDRIELEASRLNELIGRILTLARLEDGEQTVPQTPVPLGEVVANVAEDAEFEAQERHCHVHTVIPEGDWGVRGNDSLLHSAVENVVRNAIRYTQEGSSVEIELSE